MAWLAVGRWFTLDTPVSSTNKSNCHDMTEIRLISALNTITLTRTPICILVRSVWIIGWKHVCAHISFAHKKYYVCAQLEINVCAHFCIFRYHACPKWNWQAFIITFGQTKRTASWTAISKSKCSTTAIFRSTPTCEHECLSCKHGLYKVGRKT